MGRQNIDIIIQIDNKEKDLSYVKGIKYDTRRNKDGQKLLSTEMCTVKPNTKLGTTDVSFKYCFPDLNPDKWIQSSFGIELKKKGDSFSSVYTKANFDRLKREVDRSIESEVDMYYVVTDDITVSRKRIERIKRFTDNTSKIYFDNMLKFNEYLMSNKIPYITCGTDIGWVIRRLIKYHIKKYKLNY